MRIRWRGLELPTQVAKDESVSTQNYGRFIIEPFERGFGTTVGNSLRRILLSSLEGAAPVSVKIVGAPHEFASLPGVLEDVTDIYEAVADSFLMWESAWWNGRLYGLPWVQGSRVLYYNKALFRQAGLDPSQPPTTWAELLEIGVYLTWVVWLFLVGRSGLFR